MRLQLRKESDKINHSEIFKIKVCVYTYVCGLCDLMVLTKTCFVCIYMKCVCVCELSAPISVLD